MKIDGEDLDKIAVLLVEMNVIKVAHHAGEVIYTISMEREEVRKWVETYRR